MTDSAAPLDRISASRLIPAPAEEIFAVLTDPEGHVAIDASGMLQSSDGARPSQIGDSFIVHMDREALGDIPVGRYDVEVIITRLDPSVAIEWSILGQIRPPIGHVWGYQLAPAEGGTLVTSYCDWSNIREGFADLFPVIDARGLRATLGILERAVLRGYVAARAT